MYPEKKFISFWMENAIISISKDESPSTPSINLYYNGNTLFAYDIKYLTFRLIIWKPSQT